jgi:hypothetical protein
MRGRARYPLRTFLIGAMAASAITGMAAAPPSHAAVRPWAVQGSPDVTQPGGQIASVSCWSANGCEAVGSYVNTGGASILLAESWDGTAWRPQAVPNPAGNTIPANYSDLRGVSCVSPDSCQAVGFAEGKPVAEGWDGNAWTPETVPLAPGSIAAVLSSVSCPSATFCVAVGFSYTSTVAEPSLAEVWNGTAWSVMTTIDPPGEIETTLSGVSCVSPTFCEAVGTAARLPAIAEVWNGTAWQLQSVPSTAEYAQVACLSPSFCEAVGGTTAGAWNGAFWASQVVQAPHGSGFFALTGVSCVSTASCHASGADNVASGGSFGLAAAWNGATWSLTRVPSPAGAHYTILNGISCPTATACEAAGDFGGSPGVRRPVAERWAAGSWNVKQMAAPDGAVGNQLVSVSCVNLRFCAAVGYTRDISGNYVSLAEVWNGAAWKIQPTPDPVLVSRTNPLLREELGSVSCVTTSFCEAVGQSSTGQAVARWDGRSWRSQAIRVGDYLGVSCTSVRFCMAVTGDGTVTATWNGARWTAKPALRGFTGVFSVSCASASFCEAVGYSRSGRVAAVWNGRSWSVQSTPAPFGQSHLGLASVSCVSVRWCMAVGGANVPAAEIWNGRAWTVHVMPDPAGSTETLPRGVWCVAVNSCTAVGFYYSSGVVGELPFAEVWNGSTWTGRSLLPVPGMSHAVLSGVSCGARGACTSVGSAADVGGIPQTLVMTGG